jgi:hypothetical protein
MGTSDGSHPLPRGCAAGTAGPLPTRVWQEGNPFLPFLCAGYLSAALPSRARSRPKCWAMRCSRQ